MPNTSASGGYLAPTSPDLVEDLSLDEFLQGLTKGITGVSGLNVRPRWLPVPQPEPPRNVPWVAIGVIDESPDDTGQIRHFPGSPNAPFDRTLDGYDEEQRHVTITIMASFYGPNARGLANIFRDGLYVAQNREQLLLNRMAFIDVDRVSNVPELINNVWRQRVDVTFRLRRVIMRTYAVENLLEGVGTIETEKGGQRGSRPWDTANAVGE